MKLKIFGVSMQVKRRKHLRTKEEAMGIYYPGQNLIHIDADLKGEEYDQCVLHEAVHALLDRLHISPAIDEDVEEIIADSVATMITENWKLSKKR
ncbi:MAG: hypothetical protein KF767_08985 [Bdellovibrionaceae bacterium]|nr:hypothetical protein [Pseudobdellovibrionaceae bacterium]